MGDALLRRKLGWFGHMERRDERDALGRVRLVEVPGHRLPGRPRKTWKKDMEEELNSFNCARCRHKIEVGGGPLLTV